MRRSNCFIWAWFVLRRLRRKGYRVYKMTRKSDWGRFPHRLVGILHRGRVHVISYKPKSPKKRRVPPPLFDGWMRWGD